MLLYRSWSTRPSSTSRFTCSDTLPGTNLSTRERPVTVTGASLVSVRDQIARRYRALVPDRSLLPRVRDAFYCAEASARLRRVFMIRVPMSPCRGLKR